MTPQRQLQVTSRLPKDFIKTCINYFRILPAYFKTFSPITLTLFNGYLKTTLWLLQENKDVQLDCTPSLPTSQIKLKLEVAKSTTDFAKKKILLKIFWTLDLFGPKKFSRPKLFGTKHIFGRKSVRLQPHLSNQTSPINLFCKILVVANFSQICIL